MTGPQTEPPATDDAADGDSIGRNVAFSFASQMVTSAATAALTLYLVRALGVGGVRVAEHRPGARLADPAAGRLRGLGLGVTLHRRAPRRLAGHRRRPAQRAADQADHVWRALRRAVRARRADRVRVRRPRAGVGTARDGDRDLLPELLHAVHGDVRGAPARLAEPPAGDPREPHRGSHGRSPGAPRGGRRRGRVRTLDRLRGGCRVRHRPHGAAGRAAEPQPRERRRADRRQAHLPLRRSPR